MARYCGPKNRIARRFGANIFGRSRNPLLRKPNPPGQHGARRRKKSDFGLQLEEKQKLKACYGMLKESHLVSAFREARRKEGNTSQLFLQRLECRLDTLVYRLRLTRTIFGAQQLVSHGHILVDGKRVDRRSFIVRPGMEISVREKSKNMKAIQEALDGATQKTPDYIEFHRDQVKGKLLMHPSIEQIEAQLPLPINITTVCEFLAHQS